MSRNKGSERALKAFDHHRNGVSGLGFNVAIVQEEDDMGKRNMLVVRFNEDADKDTGAVVCAAFDIGKLAAGDIKFGSNSWRGDHYAGYMDKVGKKWEDEFDDRLFNGKEFSYPVVRED